MHKAYDAPLAESKGFLKYLLSGQEEGLSVVNIRVEIEEIHSFVLEG